MKGIFLNIIEGYILNLHGEEIWERTLIAAGLDNEEPWVDSLPYCKDQYASFRSAATAQTGMSDEAFLRAMCRWCVPHLLLRYASLFEGLDSPIALFAGIGERYPQIENLLPNPEGTKYEYIPQDARNCVIRYRSLEKKCPGIDSLLLGVGDHYQVGLRLEHLRCQQRGDEACEVSLSVIEQVCA